MENQKMSTLTKNQKKNYGPYPVSHYGKPANLLVEVRHDDECRNGHNTFSITGEIYGRNRRDEISGGCIHEDILAHPDVPQIVKDGIKWHLTSTDEPLHYVANALYFAGDRDCWGLRKGEPSLRSMETFVSFGDNSIKHKLKSGFAKFLQGNIAAINANGPRFDYEVLPIYHKDRPGDNYKFGPKYTFGGYANEWHECPFNSESEALDFLAALRLCNPQFVSLPTNFGEGKERELDKARNAALWPEATDEELSQEPEVLKAALLARVPGLMAEFRAYVESLGMVY